jgi:hypothetical protein
MAVIAGERCKIHLFCLDLPHSDACFVKAWSYGGNWVTTV